MPASIRYTYKKYPVSKYRKRARFRKKMGSLRRKGLQVLTLPLGTSKIVPDKLRTSLVYNESAVSFTTAVGGFAEYLFNVNSLFDPNRTGVGHQPLGFDQIASLYNRYRVYSCKAEVWVNMTSTGSDGLMCGFVPTNDGSTLSSLNTSMEHPLSSPWVAVGRADANSTNQRPIVFKISMRKITGRSKAEYDADDRYQALITADPAEVMVGHVVVASMGNNTAVQGTAVIRLTYFAEFFDRTQLSAS